MTDVKRDDERMPEQGIEPYGQADNAEERAFRVAREAIDAARGKMTRVVHSAMVEAYWTIGKEISDSVGDRAEYGKQLIAYLSRRLTTEYGKGFSEASLRNMRQFYRAFPIRYTLSSELSWSHYQHIMRVEDPEAREFYVRESAASSWGVRELKRQIDTHLYERLLHTQEAAALEGASGSARSGCPPRSWWPGGCGDRCHHEPFQGSVRLRIRGHSQEPACLRD